MKPKTEKLLSLIEKYGATHHGMGMANGSRLGNWGELYSEYQMEGNEIIEKIKDLFGDDKP